MIPAQGAAFSVKGMHLWKFQRCLARLTIFGKLVAADNPCYLVE